MSREIDTMLLEERTYPPPPEFAAQANAKPEMYDEEFDAFWEREARERLSWFRPFDELYEWEPPFAKWFLGGTLNVSYVSLGALVFAAANSSIYGSRTSTWTSTRSSSSEARAGGDGLSGLTVRPLLPSSSG